MAQNPVDTLFPFIAFASVVVVVFLGRRNRNRKRILIPDYRRGVHFVGGVFSGVLDAGSYTFDARKEQITIVDLRPQPILMDRLGFQDALKHDGLISVATELVVRDPQLAASALRDQVKDAYILTRDTIRLTMSQQIADDVDLVRLGDAIAAAVRLELRKVGMDIPNLEITELWAAPNPVLTQSIPASTVVQ